MDMNKALTAFTIHRLETENEDELTAHRIMMLFAQYFGANHGSFTKKQLARLGEWLSSSVATGGTLENAVSTCFLEHSHQLKVNRIIAPFLSHDAKAKTPA